MAPRDVLRCLSASCWAIVFCAFVPQAFGQQAASAPDFEGDVLPILAGHCHDCHAGEDAESGLRLGRGADLLVGGYRGPAIVPGKPEESPLLIAVLGDDDELRMPPEDAGEPLTTEEIDTLRRWIEAGAPGIGNIDAAAAGEQRRESDHWSFQPVVRPQLPAVQSAERVRTPIDHFILYRLEAEGIEPSPEADRATLIRRVTLDLTGLPPTPEDVLEFERDTRADAYERLVDDLLQSPHYGERWGRHWLDLARYADSNGYTIDGPRSIWKYRDWVIAALNDDMPFDRFTIEQMAGDLLPDAELAQRVATGFHRNTLVNEEGGTDDEQFRVEAVVDRVSTVGTVFLGLTLGCARCHDHKFDPVSQREFYQLFAFLNGDNEPQVEVPSPEHLRQRAMIAAQVQPLEAELKRRREELDAELARWEAELSEETRGGLADDVQAALAVPAAERNEEQKKILVEAHRAADAEHGRLTRAISGLNKQLPTVPTTLVLARRGEPRTTHIHIRGDFLRHGEQVSPDVPDVLPALPDNVPEHPTRLELARWLVDPSNPLTARVTMNRVWQAYFGRGLVETENDFGTQGSPPTHPQLLDWLASEFIERDWSLKAMHRLIVTSSTYRQASHYREDLEPRDPRNLLLARQSRLRLEAEAIRDCALTVSGLLSPAIGGPSVFPYQPEGVMRLAQVKRAWQISPGENQHRRGMYTYFWRSTPHPFLKTFDAPDSNTTCTRRTRSNTPLQALTLLNDQSFVECAEALAARIAAWPAENDTQRLRRAVRICLSREATDYELERLAELLDAESGHPTDVPLADAPLASAEGTTTDLAAYVGSDVVQTVAATDSDAPSSQAGQPADKSAWIAVARVLLNLDEFITRE